jgi:hypothetical protein
MQVRNIHRARLLLNILLLNKEQNPELHYCLLRLLAVASAANDLVDVF